MSDDDKKRSVHIRIDKKVYQSPNPTTGAALYELGDIGPNKELFREERGPDEDELISRDNTKVKLRDGDEFYSERKWTIIVNAEEKQWGERRISFEEVVKLAYPVNPPGQDIIFSVAYSNGPPQNPSGTLVAGKRVRIRNGMEFDVTPTDRS